MVVQPPYAYADSSNPAAVQASDPISDPGLLREIFSLNDILATTGEKIEGNVCYSDQLLPEQYQKVTPTDDLRYVFKRANLATLARRRTTMLEIGMNGGHSALICLMANPTLHLYAVDICWHGYTRPAAEHLKRRFGRRFQFWPGDSREVMPRLAIDRPNLRFDLLHIDGGHDPSLAIADMSNALRMATKGADFIFDDVNHIPLGEALEHVANMGYLAPLEDASRLYETPLHQVLRVC